MYLLYRLLFCVVVGALGFGLEVVVSQSHGLAVDLGDFSAGVVEDEQNFRDFLFVFGVVSVELDF